MFSRFFYAIAAIDGETLRQCPKTDRMWAAHLGAWLLLSFAFVFLISLHSTSYVPVVEENFGLRIIVAGIIACTIFLFDRALYQSDWYFHGYFCHDNPVLVRSTLTFGKKAGRVVVRVAMSFLVAYTLSIFLELAIFSGAIVDRLEKDYRKVNAPFLAKMEQYRKEQEAQAESQRAAILGLQNEVTSIGQRREGQPPAFDTSLQDLSQKQASVIAREQKVLADISAKKAEIADREMEVVAETHGTQLDRRNPGRFSGLERCGRRCRSAQQLVALYQSELETLQKQLEDVQVEVRQLSADKDQVIVKTKAEVQFQQITLDQRSRELSAEIERKRTSLTEFEVAMSARIKAYEDDIKRSGGYVALRADPLMRLRALEQLKADPVYGAVITAYSWALKLFIMFVEIVPVLGKIFFAPPSAYAIHIQKAVERHQQLDLDAVDATVWSGMMQESSVFQAQDEPAQLRRRHLTIVP